MTVDGLVLVDKPAGPTSHDVVAQLRRIFVTRKVGHAGTLDPMATGLLVVGVGRATRLLGHLAGSEKEYLATIRLGQSTTTDDAQGVSTGGRDADSVTMSLVDDALATLRGPIRQQPSAVSAVKVDGKRAHARVRAGESVELPFRDVVIRTLEVLDSARSGPFLDLQVRVCCSSGTYVRALARDLGTTLGVGGHLTSLRRTRSGHFTEMRTLDDIAQEPRLLPLDDAVAQAFPVVRIAEDQAERARHGIRVTAPADAPCGVLGVFGESGRLVGLSRAVDGLLVPEAVLVGD